MSSPPPYSEVQESARVRARPTQPFLAGEVVDDLFPSEAANGPTAAGAEDPLHDMQASTDGSGDDESFMTAPTNLPATEEQNGDDRSTFPGMGHSRADIISLLEHMREVNEHEDAVAAGIIPPGRASHPSRDLRPDELVAMADADPHRYACLVATEINMPILPGLMPPGEEQNEVQQMAAWIAQITSIEGRLPGLDLLSFDSSDLPSYSPAGQSGSQDITIRVLGRGTQLPVYSSDHDESDDPQFIDADLSCEQHDPAVGEDGV
ncbi:hypothetical protein N7462_005048 [Penicillium macrosclerotiorum]|uniref:uncharacterized protein n=1 Tax=Penicillium macrosclerotiorum TaxID=303699 RepID=UPI0025496A01|nr:uncharacterized protein N7462_005048 [Penicillium macrosclerotiorum]KAJ5690656.1 hypothetical protein N7462_005048 [Penicillium macrosclerotiorum]